MSNPLLQFQEALRKKEALERSSSILEGHSALRPRIKDERKSGKGITLVFNQRLPESLSEEDPHKIASWVAETIGYFDQVQKEIYSKYL